MVSQAAPLPKGLAGKYILLDIFLSPFLNMDLGCILSGQGPLFRMSIYSRFNAPFLSSRYESFRLDFSSGD